MALQNQIIANSFPGCEKILRSRPVKKALKCRTGESKRSERHPFPSETPLFRSRFHGIMDYPPFKRRQDTGPDPVHTGLPEI
jgi:hypothetical protein